MSPSLATLDAYIDQALPRFVGELSAFLRFPSVSDDHASVATCAEFLCESAATLGLDVRLSQTSGNPIVACTSRGASDKTRLLFYGHYDVVPAEPLDVWKSPPFEPTIRDGHIYARGAADDKGQMFAHLKALEACQATGITPHYSTRFIFDGEEEVASPNLSAFVKAHAAELQCDLMVDADGGMHRSGRPQIEFGARGILHAELAVPGGSEGQLSCNHDNFIANPAWRLITALATMRAPNGDILLDGFRDAIREPNALELDALEQIAAEGLLSTDELLAQFGVKSFIGDADAKEVLKRQLFSPTFSVNALRTGPGRDGVATAIPDRASARLCARLVPNQSPADVLDKIRMHLHRRGFDDVIVRQLVGKLPSRTPLDHPAVALAAAALADVHGRPPLFLPSTSGGASPPYFPFRALDIPCVRIPYAQFRERNAHRPNESLAITAFRDGIRVSARLIAAYGESFRQVGH